MRRNGKAALGGGITMMLILWGAIGDALAQKKGAAGAGNPSAATPSAAGPSSSASASNGPFEEQVLAYSALDQILDKLATYSCGEGTQKNAEKILILDSPTLQALQAFDNFYENAEAIKSAFNRMVGITGGGAGPDDFADVTNAVAAAATASNTETSSSFTIPDPTPALMLLRKMQKIKQQDTSKCPDRYYAGVYSVDLKGAKIGDSHLNSISEELDAVALARQKALALIMPTRDASSHVFGMGNASSATCAATPTPSAAQGFAGSLTWGVSSQDPCIAAFNNIDGTYNSFLAGLSAQNAATNQPGLASILQGYRLRGLISLSTSTKPMVGVYVSVAAAGGTQQDRKFLFTNLFTGDLIRYSGGVSVNTVVFLIAGGDFQILYSDLLRYRTPLQTIQKPANYPGGANAGDNLSSIPPVQ